MTSKVGISTLVGMEDRTPSEQREEGAFIGTWREEGQNRRRGKEKRQKKNNTEGV